MTVLRVARLVNMVLILANIFSVNIRTRNSLLKYSLRFKILVTIDGQTGTNTTRHDTARHDTIRHACLPCRA
jgi:hypothetical protein